MQLRHSEPAFERINPKSTWQHPKNTSKISTDGVDIGVLCTLHPSNLSKIDKHAAVVCIEIDLDNFALAGVKALEFCEPSKFPGVDYDLSIVTGGKKYYEIENAWKKENISLLTGTEIVDTYEADGMLSITVRFSFSSAEKTLSMDEIQQHIDTITENLAQMGVTVRMQ